MTTTTATGQYQQQGPEQEQDKWLDDALENVKKQAFFMKRALDSGDIRAALKCASSMTGELRTANLSPNNYYELYIQVTNELRELEMYFEEEDKSPEGRSVVELYENVQHAGNIIPRLYLLITVGSVYIKSKKAPAKDILFDLVELCRGVQHPMRGLFLRTYLSHISKDKLPDVGSIYENVGGTVKDAIEFVLQNFAEMNKLWVRMQHQGSLTNRTRREKERQDLRQLVGTNLLRLSELQGVDFTTYKEVVLPRILEQVVNCKDTIAQEYLMDVIISVFPDQFHLQTLELFLGTCSQLQKTVNVKNIIVALMNRLSTYARESPAEIPPNFDMFPLFHKYSSEVIEGNPNIPLEDVLSLQVALVNFASSVYPERIQYIDNVLEFSVSVFTKSGAAKVSPNGVGLVTQLLTLPLASLSLRILELQSYAGLMAFLDFDVRKTVATNIIKAVLEAGQPLDTPEKVDTLFEYISPILKDQSDGRPISDDDKFDFEQEQHLSARLFHLIKHEDTDMQYRLYTLARKHYGQGGSRRIEYSLPPLVFGSLALCRRIEKRGGDESKGDDAKVNENAPKVRVKKVFGFIHEIITALSPHYPEVALRLFLQAAQLSDILKYEAIAYEFMSQAFIVYEEMITDSKVQAPAINLLVATLQTFTNFSLENYDTLRSKATQQAAKLLKKPEQVRAVYSCAHLFWGPVEALRDPKKVLECLQRALRTANECMGHQVHLFVEVLNKYLYFFEKDCPSVTVKYIKILIVLIDENIPKLDNTETSQTAKRHYQNTLLHIRLKQSIQDDVGARYRTITSKDGDAEAAPAPAQTSSDAFSDN